MALPKLLTIEEVMEALRCSRDTVERLMVNGELRWVKVGRNVRIYEKSVLEYLALNEGIPLTPYVTPYSRGIGRQRAAK